MSEEVKISLPMFEVGELEVFDNNIHSIVEEYSKLMLKEKDQILTQRIIMKQEKEIKRLKNQLQQKENIIKEAKEYLRRKLMIVHIERTNDFAVDVYLKEEDYNELLEILDKVKENK